MGLIAGIDIGNASTEVALAELDGDHLRFVASSTIPTTGIKGTKRNLFGIYKALNLLVDKAGIALTDLSMIRINEATPVIGDVAMETITETVITESTMIGHNPSTPGGLGIGVGDRGGHGDGDQAVLPQRVGAHHRRQPTQRRLTVGLADAGGQLLHLAQAPLHLLQPLGDQLEGIAQPGFQRRLQLLVHGLAHLVELGGVGGLQLRQLLLQQRPVAAMWFR